MQQSSPRVRPLPLLGALLVTLATLAGLTAVGSLLGSCALVRGQAFPVPVIPPEPTAQDYPDVGAVVLDEVATLTYKIVDGPGDTQRVVADLDRRTRLKILTQEGRRHAVVTIPVDAYSSLEKVTARSVAPDGTVTYLDDGTMKQRAYTHFAAGTQPAAEPLREVRFLVPGSKVGGLVEVRTTLRYQDATLVPPWTFAGPLPVLRSDFGIVAEPGIKVDFRYGDKERVGHKQPLRRPTDEGNARFSFVERDLAPVYDEGRMVHLSRLSPWVAVSLASVRNDTLNMRFDTWGAVAESVRGAISRVGAASVRGSVERRYRRLRYALQGIDLDGLGLLRPTTAERLVAGVAAPTRDAGALLYNTLAGRERDVYPALLTSHTGPMAIDGLPGLYPFTRMVVAVNVEDDVALDPTCSGPPLERNVLCSVPQGSYAFIDPLCKYCRFGELPPEHTGERALVLLPKGSAWVDVPVAGPEQNRTVVDHKLTLDISGEIQGRVDARLDGVMARRLRTKLGDETNTRKRSRIVNDVLLGTGDSATQSASVSSGGGMGGEGSASTPLRGSKLRYDVRDVGAVQSVDRSLHIRARVRVQADKQSIERYSIRPMDLFGRSLSGGWRLYRRSPALLQAPSWHEDKATIELPVGYEVALPETVQLVTPHAEYAAGFVRRGRKVKYSRRLVITSERIDPDEWAEFRNLVDTIQQTEAEPITMWLRE